MPSKEYYNKWYHANKDKVKAQRVKRALANPRRWMYNNIKARAKEYGIEFAIDIEDIEIPTICPVLSIELKRSVGDNTGRDTSPSLDRIDPNKGYVKGNVRVISKRANMLKSNMTLEEARLIYEDLKRCSCGRD